MAELHYLVACSQQVGAHPDSVTAGAFHGPGPIRGDGIAVSPGDELFVTSARNWRLGLEVES